MKLKKHLIIILKEMCKRVGADFKKMDFKKKNWYWDYEWSESDQDSFKEWLMDYWKNDKEARRECLNFSSPIKRHLEKGAIEFILNFGWKCKEEK